MLATAAFVVAIAIVPPLAATAAELIQAGDALAQLGNGRVWWLLVRSVGLSTLVTVLALAAGIPLGVVFARASVPWKRLLFAMHLGIVFLPPFLPALGWFRVLGREGWLGNATSAELFFSELGVAFVLATCLAPAVTALVSLGILGVDASLDEAARVVAGPWRTAAFILVPCSTPVIALAGIMVFTLAFSELGVPMFLRVDVYPAAVFARLGGMDFAPGEAAIYALPLVLMAGALFWLERRFAGGRAIAALGNARPDRAPLFPYRAGILAACVIAAGASMVPILALLAHASTGTNVAEVARWLGEAPLNGLRASLLAAALTTVAAVVLGRALARGERLGKWLDGIGTLAFMLPSSILGVGLVLAWNRPATGWLYASFGMLVLGFVARYAALATRSFAAAVAQVPVSLDEAARSVGAGYVRRLRLLVGLLPRSVIGAFALTLVFSLRDLETAALFYPPGGEPLTVRIFTLEANGPESVVSALSVIHVLITFAVLGCAWLSLRKVSPP